LVLRTQFFKSFKTVQGQDQDQDFKKMVLRQRPVLRTTSLISGYHNRRLRP